MYLYMTLRRSCCTPAYVIAVANIQMCSAWFNVIYPTMRFLYTALIYCRQHNAQSSEPSTCVSARWAHVSYGQGVFLIRID